VSVLFQVGKGMMMGTDKPAPLCVHCHKPMKRMRVPSLTTWDAPFLWVCFNDECPYFVEGWGWMAEKYNVFASYRYKIDPRTNEAGPFPVWSQDAMKDQIIEED
jgi:hypothetical protein